RTHQPDPRHRDLLASCAAPVAATHPMRSGAHSGLPIRLNDSRHHPAVLADHPVSRESKLLVARQRPVEQEPSRNRTGVLRVALAGPAAVPGDQTERPREPRPGHPWAPIPLPTEAAPDPPLRARSPPVLVRRAVLDAWQLLGRAELTPAHALIA